MKSIKSNVLVLVLFLSILSSSLILNNCTTSPQLKDKQESLDDVYGQIDKKDGANPQNTSSTALKTINKQDQAKAIHLPKKGLLLSQAQFVHRLDENGKKKIKPGAAKMRIVSLLKDNNWQEQILEDEASNTFHKGICLGNNNLLTIAGSKAMLKTWAMTNKEANQQDEHLEQIKSNLHWEGVFGGKIDRLRDIEIGDVDGDGDDDYVIATHDQGQIAFIDNLGDEPQIIWKAGKRSFVHEIELGDSNGDGILEIFATPSEPNSSTASQGGEILHLKWLKKVKKWQSKVIASFKHQHAKEIYWYKQAKSGRLYVALEAHTEKGIGSGAKEVVPLSVQALSFLPTQKKWFQKEMITLPGAKQARVITFSDNLNAFLLTTWKGGAYLAKEVGKKPMQKKWVLSEIDKESEGFEHAGNFADLNNDGIDEIYLTTEKQNALTQYIPSSDMKSFEKTKIIDLGKADITWSIEPCVN